jgi:hypothetical protein
MIRRGTGYELYPLQSGGNDNPSIIQGAATNFDLSAMPISLGGGGQMAFYLLGLVVTFYGAVVQAGGAGSLITPDVLTATLIQSIELRNAWHGTPLQQQYCLGVHLPIIEYLGSGQRLPRREMFAIPAGNGTYAFKRTLFIPLAIGNVAKPYQTAQLALMYKKANFVINMANSSVLTSVSTGATLTGAAGTGSCSVRCSAVLEPQPNILLAPGVDWVDYQSPSSANQTQVLLNSFGNVTGLTGTNPNGGVVDLLAISGGGFEPWGLVNVGSFDPNNVVRYEFPWRGQYSTNHPEAVLAMQILALGGNGRQVWSGSSGAPGNPDNQGFPYANTGLVTGGTTPNNQPLYGLYGISLVDSTEDLQLSDVQTASQNEYYTLALASGDSFSGTNHTLARHVRSWTPGKQQDWANQVIAAGLCASVLGTNTVTSRYKTNTPQRSLSAKEAQFLPIYLMPPSSVSGGTPVIPGV